MMQTFRIPGLGKKTLSDTGVIDGRCKAEAVLIQAHIIDFPQRARQSVRLAHPLCRTSVEKISLHEENVRFTGCIS
jgi:hypothetical protein